MKIKLYFVLSLMLLLPAAAWADFDPKAYYTVDGDDFEESETINDAQAPLRVTFKANPRTSTKERFRRMNGSL